MGAGSALCFSWCSSLLATGSGVVRITGVKHHCHGLHPRHCVQAALPCRVEPGGLELQLIIARNLDKRTPAESSLEPSSESEKQTIERKRHVFKQIFSPVVTETLTSANYG